MERRQFLEASVAGAALGAAGCAGGVGLLDASGRSSADLDPAVGGVPSPLVDMNAFLARLDRGMSFLSTGTPLEPLVPRPAALQWKDRQGKKRDGEALFRKSLRSLFLVASFRDLPERERLHPGMQARMWGSLGDMDDAVLGVTEMLDALTPAARVDLQQKLKRQPELSMRLGEELDTEAARAGLSLERRLHLRSMASQLTFRLKNQSASLLIDEYVGKVKKVTARQGSPAEVQRRLAAAMSQAAFFGAQVQTEGGATVVAPPPAGSVLVPPAGSAMVPPPAGSALPAPPYPYPFMVPPGPPRVIYRDPAGENDKEAGEKKQRYESGGKLLTAGGIIMGCAVVTGIIGGAIVAGGDFAGAFVLTAGGVLLITGLVLLIVGGVQRARGSD
jgi:hypothetical protein